MSRAKSPIYKVGFRRRREGRTNYEDRLAMVKSGITRLVVRRSNKYVTVQLVDFDPAGDRTVVTVTGQTLAKKLKYPAKRNVWSAYLAGLLAGKEAMGKGVKEFILDKGRYTATKGNIVFAALKGAADAGLKSGFKEEVVPVDKLSNPPDKEAFEKAKKTIMG